MKFYLLILCSSFFNNVIFLSIFPFFPIISREKNISIFVIGVILTIFSLGSCMPIMFIKYFKDSNPFKVILYSNFTIQTIIIIFGLLSFIENKYLYCVLNTLVIFIFGAIYSFDQSFIYGSIGLIYKYDKVLKSKRYAIGKFVGNCGNFFGFVIGGFLYKNFGYSGMFLIFSIIFFGFTLLFSIILRTKIKLFNEDSFYEEQNYHLSEILTEKKIYLSFLFLTMSTIIPYVFRPGFPIHLQNAFKINESKVSYYYSSYGLGIILSNLFIIFFLKFFGELIVINFSFLFGIIGLIFIGPTLLIGLPLNIFIIISALVFLGFSRSFGNVPVFNYFYNILLSEEKFGLDAKSANMIASFFNEFLLSVGGLVGPFVGGLIGDNFKFSEGMFYYSIFSTFMFIGFIFFTNYFKLSNLLKSKSSSKKYSFKENYLGDNLI